MAINVHCFSYDQLHARCKSYRQEIQDLRSRLRDGAGAPNAGAIPMEGDHANHDLCQAVHELLNDIGKYDGSSVELPKRFSSHTPHTFIFTHVYLSFSCFKYFALWYCVMYMLLAIVCSL